MTTTKIIIEVAKLDGWMIAGTIQGQPSGWFNKNGALFDTLDCPDYLNSRDAIVPVIEKQGSETQFKIYQELRDIAFRIAGNPSELPILTIAYLPANYIAEALLRACGKWKE